MWFSFWPYFRAPFSCRSLASKLNYFQNVAWPSAILICRWSAHARPINCSHPAVELKAWVTKGLGTRFAILL